MIVVVLFFLLLLLLQAVILFNIQCFLKQDWLSNLLPKNVKYYGGGGGMAAWEEKLKMKVTEKM